MNDILKKSFLENFSNRDMTFSTVFIELLVAFVIAAYLFFLYRLITRKTFYSKNFNISIVGTTLITCAVIIVIQSSIVVSLGMVGALSIVRFRTAIKDPMDLMFLYWGIITGIICGTGFFEYAILLALMNTVAVFLFNKIPLVKSPMILIFNGTKELQEENVIGCVEKYAGYYKVKSRNYDNSSIDCTLELRMKKDSSASMMIQELITIEGVRGASLLEHDGEVTL